MKDNPKVRAGVLREIGAERRRQLMVKGFSQKHDNEHDDGAIALAAAIYASPIALYRRGALPLPGTRRLNFAYSEAGPWGGGRVRRGDRRGDLVKAAALLVAEIERLDRAARRRKRAVL